MENLIQKIKRKTITGLKLAGVGLFLAGVVAIGNYGNSRRVVVEEIKEAEIKDKEFVERKYKEYIEAQKEITVLGEFTEGEKKGEKISLDDLIINENNGKVSLTEAGIELSGDAEIYFNGIKFKRHPGLSSFMQGDLQIPSDKEFIVRGTEVIKKEVIEVNALYEKDGDSLNDFFYETHVILGDGESERENFVKINENNIKARGKGSLEILGNIEELVVDGDFTIKNGDMKFRIEEDEFFGPIKEDLRLNKDLYLTSFSITKKLYSLYGRKEVRCDFLVENEKLISFKTPELKDYINLTEFDKVNEFLKYNSEFKFIKEYIKNLKINLGMAKRSAVYSGFTIKDEKYNFPKENQEFYFENAFPISEIKSDNFDQIYEIVPSEKKQGYIFRKKR